MGALLMMTNSIATLRTITSSFHHAVAEERTSSERLTALMTEFGTDLDEVYDLDFRIPGYKRAYDCVKSRSGAERDVERVKWAMDMVSDSIGDSEVRRSAVITALLTAAIVIATLAVVVHDVTKSNDAEVALGAAALIPLWWMSWKLSVQQRLLGLTHQLGAVAKQQLTALPSILRRDATEGRIERRDRLQAGDVDSVEVPASESLRVMSAAQGPAVPGPEASQAAIDEGGARHV
jgi:hypothetical protein